MESPIQNIGFDSREYPALLKEIPKPPSVLNYLGQLPREDEVMVAIVGTRKATREGRLLAKQIGRDLARRGATVVSGLALGIDAAAHEGALAGGGKTIAVLGNGLPTIYPLSHEHLAKSILETHGCIFSEYPKGTPALPHQFLERNRIISGLSLGTVIVEAPARSGALVTARHAIEQGREVFVLPGPADHPNFKGSHLLIRNGARLVTSVEDILEDLSQTIANYNCDLLQKTASKLEKITDKNSLKLVKALQTYEEPLTIDSLIEIAKLEPHIVSQHLTFLMFEGIVEEKNGEFKLKL